MQTVPDVKKIATKSKLRSNPFRKVEGENFSYSACTLVKMMGLPIDSFIKLDQDLLKDNKNFGQVEATFQT